MLVFVFFCEVQSGTTGGCGPGGGEWRGQVPLVPSRAPVLPQARPRAGPLGSHAAWQGGAGPLRRFRQEGDSYIFQSAS